MPGQLGYYHDYSAALEQVTELVKATHTPVVNVHLPALLLGTCPHSPDSGYHIDDDAVTYALQFDSKYVGVPIAQQVAAAAARIRDSDRTNGTRSMITRADSRELEAGSPAERTTYTIAFGEGSILSIVVPKYDSEITWQVTGPDDSILDSGYLDWIGHDHIYRLLVDQAATLRQLTLRFNPKTLINERRVGPSSHFLHNVMTQTLPSSTANNSPTDEEEAFTNRFAAVVESVATHWFATQGVELTLERVDASSQGTKEDHAQLAPALNSIVVRPNHQGNLLTAHGWMIDTGIHL